MTSTLLAVLNWLLPAVYLLLWGAHARDFLKDTPSEEPSPRRHPLTTRPVLYATILLHLSFTVLRGVAQQAWPMASKAEFFSLLAISVFASWLFSQRQEDDSQTGIFFLGITACFQTLAAFLMVPVAQATHSPLLEHPVYGIHVIFTVLGFAALAVGALHASMYILLSRQLKARDLGLFFKKLPPLIQLEEMSRIATSAGILLLGAGLALGHFVALYVLKDFTPWDPKIILTDLAWGAYFIGLIVVRLRGLGGLRIGYLSLGAFLALMLTVALSNLLFPSFHSFQG